jgi:putative transposase
LPVLGHDRTEDGVKSRFSEEQILGILREAETGRPIEDLAHENGITGTTFYRWRKKYSAREARETKRLQDLEDENRKLKQLVAELTLENHALRDRAARFT